MWNIASIAKWLASAPMIRIGANRLLEFWGSRVMRDWVAHELHPDQYSFKVDDVFEGNSVFSLHLTGLVQLDVQHLNKTASSYNLPVEFIDASFDSVHVYFHYNLSGCRVVVNSLRATVSVKERLDSAMLSSMVDAMFTSSHETIEEFMSLPDSDIYTSGAANADEVLNNFTAILDTMMSKIQVDFDDTIIKIEHFNKDTNSGIGLVMNIDKIYYRDYSATEDADEFVEGNDNGQSTLSSKNIKLENVRFSTMEFFTEGQADGSSKDIDSETNEVYSKCRSDVDEDSEDEGSEDEDRNDEEKCDYDSEAEEEERKRTHDSYYSGSNRHIIPFAFFVHTVEVILKMKLRGNSSPEVTDMSTDLYLGSVLVFLSPRQMHLLLELASELLKSDNKDDGVNPAAQNQRGGPMTSAHYAIIERDLMQTYVNRSHRLQSDGLKQARGWSGPMLDDSDDDPEFQPMDSYHHDMSDSISIASSMSSSMTSAAQMNTYDKLTGRIDVDPNRERTSYQVHATSLTVVLLHEDVLVWDETLKISSVAQLQAEAKEYFSKTKDFFSSIDNDYFKMFPEVLNRACSRNHLRLLAAPMQFEIDSKTSAKYLSTDGRLEIAQISLSEYTKKSREEPWKVSKLITFYNQNGQISNATSNLCLTINHAKKLNPNAGFSGSMQKYPYTTLKFTLRPATLDIDVTILDRISNLLTPVYVCSSPPSKSNLHGQHCSNSHLVIDITSKALTVNLRFPQLEAQFFEKKVTHDYLQLVLSNAFFRTCLHVPGHYELQCKNIDVSYYENENSTPEHIASTDISENSKDTCRLSITTQEVPSSRYFGNNTNVRVDPTLMQSTNIIDPSDSSDLGPFSCKKVVHESSANAGHHNAESNTELKMPGDKQEIKQFIETTTATSAMHFEIELPTVSMQLISKHTYELLYNRIVNGLLLWEPKAPKLRTTSLDCTENEDDFQSFQTGSDGESCDSDEEDRKYMQKIGLMSPIKNETSKETKKKSTGNNGTKGSNLTINFRLASGLLCLHAPVRDSFSNVIPNQHGEFLIKVAKANLFFVSGYMGDQDLSYMSSEIYSAKMYHCAQTTTAEGLIPTLRKIDCRPGEHFKSTIHPSNKEVLLNTAKYGGKREMITVAVKIQKNQCIHQNAENFKKFTISAGFNKMTLRHRPVHSPNNWYSQLIDFFNVPDHPIPGYEYTRSITELYAYFWDSAVDYRPMYLKLRAILTLGSFTVSCHLSSEDVSTIVLRIIAEDCRFFLSDKVTHVDNKPFSFEANLERDYVNVVEMNLFEISVKLSKEKMSASQFKDLRASTNMIYIRVCYDSLSALSDFITYFCNSGDLSSSSDIENSGSSTYSSPSHQQDQELISLGAKNRNAFSKNSEKRIGDLLTDAIEDVPVQQPLKVDRAADQNSRKPSSYGAAFLFPEEKDDKRQFPQVTKELGNIYRGCFDYENDDLSEFVVVPCDLVHDPVAEEFDDGYTERSEYLCPITSSSNQYFAKRDKYGSPVERYTLSEMSLKLCIYDGNDFGSTTDGKSGETTKLANENTVRFSNKQPDRVTFTNSNSKNSKGVDWMLRGGVNRKRDVHVAFWFSKVFYDNQIYSPNHTVASKQDLSIADMEVLDGVEASYVTGNMLHALRDGPKESTPFLKIQKVMERDISDNTHQLCMKVSGVDLKVDIDQITLLFLIKFFDNLSGCSSTEIQSERRLSKQNTPVHQPPIMTVNDSENTNVEEKDLPDTDDLLILSDDRKVSVDVSNENDSLDGFPMEDGPTYIKQIIFDPAIKIQMFYKGRDIISPGDGFLKGIVMGLVNLDSSTFYLRSYQNDKGVKGFDNLWNLLLQHWKDDLANQKFGIISGIPPLGTLVLFFSGLRDLIVMPIAQYRKDGRIMKGLHRGANSFTISTCTAALDLARNVFTAIQFTAEAALEIFAVTPVKEGQTPHRKGRRKRKQYPKDFKQGATNALATFTGGFQETFENFRQVAVSKRDNKGYVSASATVLGKLPAFAAEGLAITFQAANDIVEGTHNQMHPDHKKEEMAKWRTDELSKEH